MEDAFIKSTFEVKQYFKCEELTGLSDDQIKESLKKFGPNGYCTLMILIL